MNVADSSTFLDSPAASKLGTHRAILTSEEDGRSEKFRPYGPPPEEWLAQVKEQARALRVVPSPDHPRVVRITLSESESPLQ
jgi:hypothetical protein